MSQSKFKATMIVLFSVIHEILYLHRVSQGHIINQYHFVYVFAEMCEKAKRKATRKSHLVSIKIMGLLPPHLMSTSFSAQYNIPILDLSSYDTFIF